MADHVLAALPDSLLPQLTEWFDSFGTNPVKYEELKAYRLKKFTCTPEQRVKCILDLAQQPLGDQHPSDALTELRSLARLPPDASGDPKSLEILLALWLTRLPAKVRACITDFNAYADDDAIATTADRYLDGQNAAAAVKSPIATLATDVPPEADDEFPASSAAVAQATPSFQRRPRPAATQRVSTPPPLPDAPTSA